MKRIRIAVVLLVAVVGLCIATGQYQHRRVGELLDTLDRIEAACNAGDMATANTLAEDFAATFDRVSNVMDCYVAHDDLAESRETAALLPSLLRQGGEEELSMELHRLREQLLHLQQIDDLLLRNIL